MTEQELKECIAEVKYSDISEVSKKKIMNVLYSQLHKNGWIPCEDGLPDDGEIVLASDSKYVYLVEYDADLDASFGDLDGITAWQPSPESYHP